MGGPGTICIDEISATLNLQMAEFSAETHNTLKSACAPMANIGKPNGYIDLTAAHFEKLHNQVLSLLFQDENIDLVLQILAPSAFINQKLIVEEIAKAYESQTGRKKPFLNAVTFGQFALETRQGLEDAGLPTVEHPDSLPRVAGNMTAYAAFRRTAAARAQERGVSQEEIRRPGLPVSKIIASAIEQGRTGILEPEAYEVCTQYKIDVPPFRMADTFEAAAAAASQIGYPIVLKVVFAEILHMKKADSVILGVKSDGVLEQSYRELAENIRSVSPHIQRPQILIQKMIPVTTELILGAIRDQSFGPVVMFGLGGICIEAIKPVRYRLAPLSIREASDLVFETLPPALIQGASGRAAMNVDSVASALVSLGRLLTEHPGIEQVKLNPVLPYGDGCVAVNARIILSKKK